MKDMFKQKMYCKCNFFIVSFKFFENYGKIVSKILREICNKIQGVVFEITKFEATRYYRKCSEIETVLYEVYPNSFPYFQILKIFLLRCLNMCYELAPVTNPSIPTPISTDKVSGGVTLHVRG